MFFKLAWRNIWRNKTRSFITMGLIFLFTLQVISFQSLKKGTMLAVIDGLAGGYLGYVHVHEKDYWETPFLENAMESDDELIEQIKSADKVDGVSARMSTGVLISQDSSTFFGMLVGVDVEDEVTGLLEELKEREHCFDDRGVVVSEGLAKKHNILIGDTLAFTGQGMYGSFAADLMIVREIMTVNTLEMNGRLLIVSNNYFRETFTAEGFTSELVVGVEKQQDAELVRDAIIAKVDTSKYEVFSWKELRPEFDQMNELNDAGNVIMAGILYLLVFFGFLGTTMMMISERKREFGVLISIGLSKYKLMLINFIETVTMSLLAGGLAFLLAFPLIYHFQENPIELYGSMKQDYEAYGLDAILKTTVDIDLFLTNAVIVFALAVIVNIISAIKVLSIRPVDAIKGN
jgi:putative ABC transport system permease protein